MPRRLFTLCSGCSLLLCVAVCGLWGLNARRSYHLFCSPAGGGFVDLVSDSGRISVTAGTGWPHDAERVIGESFDVRGRIPAFMQTRPWFTSRPYEARTNVRGPWSDDPGDTLYTYILPDGTARAWFEDDPMRPETPLPACRVAVHDAVAAGVLAILPAVWWRRAVVRRRRRRLTGRCPACGYDLRATPDRCPECGAEPAGNPQTAEAERKRVHESSARPTAAGEQAQGGGGRGG